MCSLVRALARVPTSKTNMLLVRFVPLLVICIIVAWAKETWHRPGCHKVGNTRKISIPDCVEFYLTTNACRGFCESYAVPSPPLNSLYGVFKAKPVVSVGQCCNMMESEEIHKRVLCLDGFRNVTFKSAVSCSCYHCKKQ